MRVLLTGATGFLGSHTARALQDRELLIRVLVRDAAKLGSVTARVGVDIDGLEVVQGDITDESAVREAVAGCDAVVHAAAVVATDPSRDAEVEATNHVGAGNVLCSAVEQGCDPVIHVSSSAALFPFRTDPVGPDHPVGPGRSAYGRTKARSEELARGLQAEGHPVVIVYPAMLIGPDDWNDSEQIGAMRLWLTRPYPRSAGFTLSFVDVRDVAAVLAESVRAGRGARRYVVFGHHLTCEEHIAVLGSARGRPLRTVPVPRTMLWLWGRMGDAARRFGRDLVLTSEGYEYMFNFVAGDNSLAEAESGVELRPVVDSFRDTIRWLHATGRISDSAAGAVAGP